MNWPHILIVNDNPALLLYIGANLRARGYETMLVEDGKTALDCIEESIPDLVILDDEILGTSSLKISRSIRDRAMIPIVMTTSDAELASRDNQGLLDLGINVCIIKPFGVEALLTTIGTLLQQRKPKLENNHFLTDSPGRETGNSDKSLCDESG